jgi:hypothetical protein
VAGKRVGRVSESVTLLRPHLFLPSISMPQQPDLESLSREDRVILALQAIKSNAPLSQRRAAAIYNVPQSTLSNRYTRTAARRDYHANSSKLTRREEEAIVQRIRKLDTQGFAPTLSYIREIANQLLAVRSSRKVREKWARNLIRRKPTIKSQVTRQRDHQRVLCSNPAIISP